MSLCASAKREIFARKSHFFGSARRNMFFCAVPETTIFIVVSGPHTEMGLAVVSETTIILVVSGTSGERGKPAEPKKGGKSRMRACFGVLCLKPLFL